MIELTMADMAIIHDALSVSGNNAAGSFAPEDYRRLIEKVWGILETTHYNASLAIESQVDLRGGMPLCGFGHQS